jgi:hypothetical protein
METDHQITCSRKEVEKIEKIARSRTAGIWRIKRAKIIMGTLERKTVDRLVLDVRVPPRSIEKCQEKYAKEGLKYFEKPDRRPTQREAAVERMLAFLEEPPHPGSRQWNSLAVHYIGRDFTARQIRKIRDLIASNQEYSRTEIAHQVCLMFGLYQYDGKPKKTAAGGILKRMDMDNIITLPPVSYVARKKRVRIEKTIPEEPSEKTILHSCDLEFLQFIPVRTQKDSYLWNDLLDRHHYINSHRLFGAQMRYLVYGGKRPLYPTMRPGDSNKAPRRSSRQRLSRNWKKLDPDTPRCNHLLAILGFGASAWRMSSRDEYIGWTDEQRAVNLNLVVGNVRFLILPWIESRNLASRILGGITRQLPLDWEARYGFRPVLLETFVQLDRFRGTCYRAANWIQVGTTQGYSLYGKEHKKSVPAKAIFVYPLHRNFRQVLCKT